MCVFVCAVSLLTDMYRKISHNIFPCWVRKRQVIIRLLLSAQLTCQVEVLLTQLRMGAEIFREKFVERSLPSGLHGQRKFGFGPVISEKYRSLLRYDISLNVPFFVTIKYFSYQVDVREACTTNITHL